MDHEMAMRIQAAERYVLDEFSLEERAEFEEHYFGCAQCADEVKSASILAANASRVFREEREKESASRERSAFQVNRRMWWPLALSAALNIALLAGFGLERRRSRDAGAGLEPQFYQEFGVPSASRGSEKTISIPPRSGFFGARFDLMPGQHFDSFEFKILDPSGGARSDRWLKAPPDEGSELELAVPVSALPPGQYELVLRGKQDSQSVEISRVRVLIQR
jgi:hypothetical protein